MAATITKRNETKTEIKKNKTQAKNKLSSKLKIKRV